MKSEPRSAGTAAAKKRTEERNTVDKKWKIGVFGTWRGIAFIKALQLIDEAEVTAICDRDEEKIEAVRPFCPENVVVAPDFDALLDSGIDAVILCNYFYEHTPYAIRAMERGVHVLSETMPAVTMQECVLLTEAVERTGCIYSFAENYPFSRANMELSRVYHSGILGEVTFAEGEYVHPMSPEEDRYYAPTPTHWRRYLPKTYYLTHALAPLMAATDLMPKRVIGKVAAGRAYCSSRGHQGADGAGILLVEMEGGALFRVAGSCHFGTRGNWYRLGCEKGDIANVRGTNDKVRLAINEWDLTEETRNMCTESIYSPAFTELGHRAMKCGHYGGDFWVTYHFVQDLLHARQPYMDVYRAAAISATGILGWRSVLDDSRQLDIPDFRDRAQRESYRDDALCPFPIGGKAPTLPASFYPAD